tara:strand:+ start:3483 stop:4067 length:585 start_codon:yes stop_codon:yes gene_type:complete
MVNEVLNFWFDYENNPDPLYNRTIWWQKNEHTDNIIREKFANLNYQATSGQLDSWLASPKSTLAFIILIDQFSRNLYRNTPKMFAHDSLALNAAKNIVASSKDKILTLTERVFLYLPFEHSENFNDQEMSIALYQRLVDETPEAHKKTAEAFLSFAQAHYDIIEKFGRYPHRNKILSRDSTADEIDFMKTHQGF